MILSKGGKPPLDELVHFGVKGMKWGVRAGKERDNPKYSKSRRSEDEVVFGKKGVQRINRRMNRGKTYKQASDRELILGVSKAAALVGVSIAAAVLNSQGGNISAGIRNRAETNRGAAAAKNVLGPSNRINAKNKRGVFNVTTL